MASINNGFNYKAMPTSFQSLWCTCERKTNAIYVINQNSGARVSRIYKEIWNACNNWN